MSINLSCFMPYDIRGKLGTELTPELAYQIGFAFAQYLNAKTIVIGCDIRNSSPELKQATSQGIIDFGADVIDLGMTGSEEVYFAAFHLPVCGGVEITASHNPIDYNGMKFVGAGASPISGDFGLPEIKAIISNQDFKPKPTKGRKTSQNLLPEFVNHLLSYLDFKNLKPFKLVVNSGNGAAGHVIDAIELVFKQNQIPVEFIKIHHEPNGDFPNGIPNPIILANQASTQQAVLKHQADFGIAWDGDFDRCFLFDENGKFIEGYYVVGLLAQAFLALDPNQKIIHDPRLTWNTIDLVNEAGGEAVKSKTGHAFIKAKMRAENAVYGGEMSAHHYFRDFAYCDSGMIPWLLVLDLINKSDKTLSQLVKTRVDKFPCSGEINFKVDNVKLTLNKIHDYYANQALAVDFTDGLGFEFDDWRFNVRGSNTEALLRLNVETKWQVDKVDFYVKQITKLVLAKP